MRLSNAFYPCCANDISEPCELLRDIVENIYFCDPLINTDKTENFDHSSTSPVKILLPFKAEDVLEKIPNIDVLFYRRDGASEGGSGLFVLGDSFLPQILSKFNSNGGLIITDGSNSRGNIYRTMKRANGLFKERFQISLSDKFPFLRDQRLDVFDVTPATLNSAS